MLDCFLKKIFIHILYAYVLCMHAKLCTTCISLIETRRTGKIRCNWELQMVVSNMMVLGFEP